MHPHAPLRKLPRGRRVAPTPPAAKKRDGEFTAGDRVKLSGRYLVNTGQRKGGEGCKTWTVQACGCELCAGRGHVAVDEPIAGAWFTADELAACPGLAWRHVAAANLVHLGRPSLRNESPFVGKLLLGHRT